MMENKRAWVEIELENISANIGFVRDRIGSEIKMMAVVKADGYGHGAVRAAEAALGGGADMLGVAVCEEGLLLRTGGIAAPILVLGCTPESLLTDAVKAGLTLAVTEPDMALSLARHSRGIGKTATVHIKIDTGMSRLGFTVDDRNIKAVAEICGLAGIRAEGIFTHFADAADRAFTYKQCECFNYFIEKLAERGVVPKLRHAANSTATMLYPECYYDMVRIGIMTYGLSPEPFLDIPQLRPALSLMSRVSQVRRIKAGTSVGYSRKFVADRETVVATASIGYADGYTRALGGKAFALIRGNRVPVIGGVCMDQLMLDVTDIDGGNIGVGETVTLIGRDGDCQVTAEELAELLGTVNYEIVSGIGKRVPRVYKT